jgi:hypothetical protein
VLFQIRQQRITPAGSAYFTRQRPKQRGRPSRPAAVQVLGAKVRLMSLQEALLELELDAVDAAGQLCQVGRRPTVAASKGGPQRNEPVRQPSSRLPASRELGAVLRAFKAPGAAIWRCATLCSGGLSRVSHLTHSAGV